MEYFIPLYALTCLACVVGLTVLITSSTRFIESPEVTELPFTPETPGTYHPDFIGVRYMSVDGSDDPIPEYNFMQVEEALEKHQDWLDNSPMTQHIIFVDPKTGQDIWPMSDGSWLPLDLSPNNQRAVA